MVMFANLFVPIYVDVALKVGVEVVVNVFDPVTVFVFDCEDDIVNVTILELVCEVDIVVDGDRVLEIVFDIDGVSKPEADGDAPPVKLGETVSNEEYVGNWLDVRESDTEDVKERDGDKDIEAD
jgi:hypothetical protein